MMDDPTPGGGRDGLDPGEEHRSPDADRHHGAVRDTAHPDYFTAEHRYLQDPMDLDQPERSLVVDDHASRTTGASALTQADIGGRPAIPGETRPDRPGDPRRGLPTAEPDST